MKGGNRLRILFVSTTVGALGSGLGGGVELTLRNIGLALKSRGHEITVLAPAESISSGLNIVQIPGELQPTAQTQGRDAPIVLPPNSVLGNLWQTAYQQQHNYDVLLNFAYDWLPFYLTPFFDRPIAHLVSMGSLTDAMDQIIGQTLEQFPASIGVHSKAQAETFPFGERCRVLGNGLDLSLYQFRAEADRALGWVGRIAPEKGIEDAIEAAQQTGLPLKIWGAMPDKDYWRSICERHPNAVFSYEGFLSTEQLQRSLGQCRGLLMTPKWVEAFGNVAIEALACGVPVIAYRRGGPAEIVQDGRTGWLVEPDSVSGLVDAIQKLDKIDRQICRLSAEQNYSMQAMGERVEGWLLGVVGSGG
ncbi:glycosyltransferase family 4 protein [Leptolyngbya ohadii]|uniref:glycosyltransferase family 4 protein n=1 Tax=Leptolyngbya ohadii TaxID=1962290 RepID=UPI000B59BE98|nr:glycosyltransferase family 4 protein [Leptolyngbya ohadii]